MIYVILLFCFIMSLLNLIQVSRYGSSLLIKMTLLSHSAEMITGESLLFVLVAI